MELRELQLFELDILKEFDRICRNNQLQYFLACGTLLGAIRHQGFIPWDDDIDVYMPYEDYIKFAKICEKEINSEYYFQSRNENPQNFIYWNRIGRNNTTSIDLSLANIHMQWGICIDIFPLFPYSDDEKIIQKRTHWFKRYELLSLKYLHLKTADSVKGVARLKKKIHGIFNDKTNLKLFHYYETKLGTEFQDDSLYMDYECSKICGGFKKEWFSKPCEMKFEDSYFYVPNGYHEYLTAVYGDYMMPPKDKGKHSDNPNVYISFDEPYEKYWKD